MVVILGLTCFITHVKGRLGLRALEQGVQVLTAWLLAGWLWLSWLAGGLMAFRLVGPGWLLLAVASVLVQLCRVIGEDGGDNATSLSDEQQQHVQL